MLTKTTGEKVFAGAIFDVFRERWTDARGATVSREVVRKPPAVAVLAYDDDVFWIVYQAREAVGDAEFMELPAGRLDKDGEELLDCARRELEEECGLKAEVWDEIGAFYTSPGFTDERVTVYAATLLTRVEKPAADDTTIAIAMPLEEIETVRRFCDDAKTLIALGWLAERLAAPRTLLPI